MKKIFYIPGIIFALAVVVFALLQSLSAVVYGGMDFYRQEFIKHDVAAAVDMEVEDVVRVMEHTLEYMRGNEDELQVETVIGGEPAYFYNEREIMHMADVRVLTLAGYQARAIALAVALGCLAVLIAGRVRWGRLLSRSFLVASVILLAFIGFIAICALKDFNSFWTAFHGVFFTNDLWLFDPAESRMINIMPEGFFYDIVTRFALIFGIFITAVLAASIIGTVVTRRRKHR